MSANFTPSLNSYTDLTPFRFWCQKILPLVYDDSLSYYELLCKVVDYLNKTMEDVNLSIEDVEKLHTAYDSLQKYVNDYFDNLDVQNEINNKLDALVEDGTIHDIFNPDVEAILNVARQAASDAIDAIPSNVTAWLDTHVTPKTTVVIDESLTISGAAADAKTVGLRLNAYVTPEQFGAVGDGTTDDAVALQEALNSELPTLLTKTYGIRSGLTISHDKVVICGEKAVIKALTNVQNCLTIGENPTTGDDAAISGLIQVLWKGGTIDCGDSGFDRGFVFYRTYHSWISDVTVKNCYGTGFFLTGTYGAETFLNNCCVIGKSASYGQVGFTVGANDQRIINCSAVNMRTGFLSDRGAVKFENCTAWVTYDDTWETTIAFDILGTANELIDCVVDTMHTGVKLYNSTTLFKVTNIRWLHNQQVIPSFVGMTLFEGNTENVNVVGNVDGIQIQGYSQSVYLKKNLADKFIIKNAYAIDSTYIEGYGDVVNTAERILALEDDVSDLKSDLNDLGVEHINLYSGRNNTLERYVNANNGELVFNADFQTSDYIDVSNLRGQNINASYTFSGGFYDENKTYISALGRSDSVDITVQVPENAYYARICCSNANEPLMQLGVGVTRSNYIPYKFIVLNNLIPNEDESVKVEKKNLFDKNNVAINTSITNKGNTSPLQNFNASWFIDIGNGEFVTAIGCFNMAIYNEDKTFSRMATRRYDNYPLTAKLNGEERYVRVTVRNANLNNASIENNFGVSDYTESGNVINANQIDANVCKTTTVYVGDGCYFTSINDALNEISDNSPKNKYVIMVTEGEYNETITTKDYVDIVGESKYKSIINYISDDESDYVNRSAIFASTYTTLKNLTVRTTGSKYPLHCDARYNEPYKVKAINCIFKHDGFTGETQPAGTAVGIGLYWGQHVELELCECIGSSVTGVAAVYCHNSNEIDAAHSRFRSLVIKNCKLSNATYGLRLQAIEANELQSNECIYVGNKNTATIPVSVEAVNYQSWHVYSIGNEPSFEQ